MGPEVWTRSPDTGHAGWVDQQAADIENNLLIKNLFAVAKERHLRVFCLGPTGDLRSLGIPTSGLTTIDDGSTMLGMNLRGVPGWKILVAGAGFEPATFGL